MNFPRNLRYSPVNWLIVDWGFGGARFNDCGLPQPQPCASPEPAGPARCETNLIREAISTYGWERWLPEVIVGIDDPDEEIAASYVREAAITFAKRSRVLQRQVLIALQPGVCTYPVEPYAEENIVGVIGAAFDDGPVCGCHTQCSAFMPNDIEFRLDTARNQIHLEESHGGSCCGQAKVLRVLVWSAPSEDACEQDVFLYDHFRKAIAQEARRTYSRAVHFRDRALMNTIPKEDEFDIAISRAKVSAMGAHSWSKTPSGSGMWSNQCGPGGTWR